jgi:hypothetical protein
MGRAPQLPAPRRAVEKKARRPVVHEETVRVFSEIALELDAVGEHIHVGFFGRELKRRSCSRDERIAGRLERNPRARGFALLEIGAQHEMRRFDAAPWSARRASHRQESRQKKPRPHY